MQHKVDSIKGTVIKIGEMTFKLKSSKIFDMKIPEGFQDCKLIAGTPIIVRIPRYRLPEYGITPRRDYDYVYWRKEYTPTAFIKQLEENLIKKYNEYHDAEVEPTTQLFETLRFRKQVATPLLMRGQETTIIGTLWEFQFTSLINVKNQILQFGLDAGFGEMNSLGFGFMNLHDNRKEVTSSMNNSMVS
jgi:CRISPR-associated endoribonuclease Cas6